MKKITIILLTLAMIAAPSCKNQNKKNNAGAEATKEISEKEKLVTEDLKANVQNLIESTKQMKPAPFVSVKDGSVKLTEQEQMAKPDYLLDPGVASNLVTLTQKYRAIGMYSIDKEIARLYGMSVEEYTNAINGVAASVNDPAFNEFQEKAKDVSVNTGEIFSKLLDDEVTAGRANFFWEGSAAALVEQVFVLTQNIDKFMPMFDDQAASDITYNFVTVHEGIKSMMEFYPEMESLNKIIEPLYVINAINVEQLKSQLIELKGEIAVIRTLLAK